MSNQTLLIIVVLLVIFGGGFGNWGDRGPGYGFGSAGWSIPGVLLVLVIVLALLGRL